MGEPCNFSIRRDLTAELSGNPREMCVCSALDFSMGEDLCGWEVNNWTGCSSATKRSARKTNRTGNNGGSKQDTHTPPQIPLFMRDINQPAEKPFKFRHFVDPRYYMTDYRRHCVVRDENLSTMNFGFDSDSGTNMLPDPYEFKINKYRELFQRLDSLLQTENRLEKLDEKNYRRYSSFVRPVVLRSHGYVPRNFWTRILETLRVRNHSRPRREKAEDFLAKYRHGPESLRPRHPGKLLDSSKVPKQTTTNTTTSEHKELQLPIIQTSYASLALTAADNEKDEKASANSDSSRESATDGSAESVGSESLPSTRYAHASPSNRPLTPQVDKKLYCVEGKEIQAVQNAKSCLDLLYGPPAPNVKFPFSVQIVHDMTGVQGSKRSYQPPLRRSSSVPLKEMQPLEGLSTYRLKLSDAKDRKRAKRLNEQSDKYVSAARENFERAREKFFGSRPNTSGGGDPRNQPSVASVRDIHEEMRDAGLNMNMNTLSDRNNFNSQSFVNDRTDEKLHAKKETTQQLQKQDEEQDINEPHEGKLLAKGNAIDKDTATGVRWESSLNTKQRDVDVSQQKKPKSKNEVLPQIEYRSRYKLKTEDKDVQERLISLRLSPVNSEVREVDKDKNKKTQQPPKQTPRAAHIKVRIMEISDTREQRKASDEGPAKLGIKGQATGPEIEKRRKQRGNDSDKDLDGPKTRKVDTSTPRDKLVEVPKFMPSVKMAELNRVVLEGNPYVTEDQHRAFINAKARTG